MTTRNTLALLALFAFSTVSIPAFAADVDGDGVDATEDCDDTDASIKGKFTVYLDADGDGFGSAATTLEVCAMPPGYSRRDNDCNDDPSAGGAGINPRATDIPNDTIDQDCSGADSTVPMGLYQAFKAKGYRGDLTVFAHELAACRTHAACVVNPVDAQFVIVDDTYAFVDAKRNTTNTARCKSHSRSDGLINGVFPVVDGREVVEVATVAEYPLCPGGSGMSRAAVTKAVDGLREEVDAELEIVDGLINGLEDELHTEVRERREGDRQHDVQIARLTGRVTSTETRIGNLETDVERIDGVANTALDTANLSASHGVYFDALVLGGVSFQKGRRYNGGTKLRTPVMGGGGFGLNVGADLPEYRFGGFGEIHFGNDGAGGGADTAFLLGTELTRQVSNVLHIGGMLGYRSSASRLTAVDVTTEGNALIGGLSVPVLFTDSVWHPTMQLRLWGGYEWYASKADGPRPGNGPVAGLSLGFGAGASALQ